MSKAREALDRMLKFDYATHEKGVTNFHYDWHKQDEKVLNDLVTRDEPKTVLHENTLKQFGKCPVCNASVTIRFHRQFCGECGNRLTWINGKEQQDG